MINLETYFSKLLNFNDKLDWHHISEQQRSNYGNRIAVSRNSKEDSIGQGFDSQPSFLSVMVAIENRF